MHIFQQSSGKLFRNTEAGVCKLEGEGYSGHGAGVNNPQLQERHDVGPIPQGMYLIEVIRGTDGQPCDYEGKKAPVMRLTPEPGTETFGRSGFLIHGDLVGEAGQEEASLGCIIMPHSVRVAVAASGDYLLKVIA